MSLCTACAGPPHLMQFNGTCIQQKINEWVPLSLCIFLSGSSHIYWSKGLPLNSYKYQVCPMHNVTQKEESNKWDRFHGVLGSVAGAMYVRCECYFIRSLLTCLGCFGNGSLRTTRLWACTLQWGSLVETLIGRRRCVPQWKMVCLLFLHPWSHRPLTFAGVVCLQSVDKAEQCIWARTMPLHDTPAHAPGVL